MHCRSSPAPDPPSLILPDFLSRACLAVTIIQGKMEDLELPVEKVDIIIR